MAKKTLEELRAKAEAATAKRIEIEKSQDLEEAKKDERKAREALAQMIFNQAKEQIEALGLDISDYVRAKGSSKRKNKPSVTWGSLSAHHADIKKRWAEGDTVAALSKTYGGSAASWTAWKKKYHS